MMLPVDDRLTAVLTMPVIDELLLSLFETDEDDELLDELVPRMVEMVLLA